MLCKISQINSVPIPRPSSCWKAIRQMLANPETRKVLQSLQKKNVGRLQAAAQSALQGDTTALSSVLQELSSDPQAAKAMEQLNKTLNK